MWQIHRCIRHQTKIGWHNLLFGRISPNWKECQWRYITQYKTRHSADKWAATLIKHLWQILFHLWDARNKTKHHGITTTKQNKIVTLHQEITIRYEQGVQDMNKCDHHLLEHSIKELLTYSSEFKIKWLASVDAARNKYMHQQQNQSSEMESAQKAMKRWLTSNNDQS